MRLRTLAIGLLASLLLILVPQRPVVQAADTLPSTVTDAAFWKMISDFSEKGGTFAFEMYMSNEITFQNIIPDLVKQAPQGGVYLGVAPEQNFTYITVLRPRMAFILDIRRDNMVEMLMYKALFELSPNRGEFISRLFSRKLPARASGPSPDPQASVDRLFDALTASRPDTQFFTQNLQAIKNHLQKTRGFPLSPEDLRAIDKIYNAFFRGGPDASLTTYGTSYRLLMRAADGRGHNWNFLASEPNYQFVRQMQQKNLIVPVVADFAGPKGIRAVARYVQNHGALVSAFYVSNVEEYIMSPPVWSAYCKNLATLPVNAASTFIRFGRGGRGSFLNAMQPFIQRGVPQPFIGKSC
jgi:hypothetical protein